MTEVENAEHEFATAAFNILNMDALFQILAKLDPKSVLELCKTTPAFRRLCSQTQTFTNLMTLHYPQHDLDPDVKLQYMALALGRYVLYNRLVPEVVDPTDPNNFLFEPLYPEDKINPGLLRISGVVQTERAVWILSISKLTWVADAPRSMKKKGESLAFKTKKECLDFAYGQYITDVNQQVDAFFRLGEVASFDEALDEMDLDVTWNDREIFEREIIPNMERGSNINYVNAPTIVYSQNPDAEYYSTDYSDSDNSDNGGGDYFNNAIQSSTWYEAFPTVLPPNMVDYEENRSLGKPVTREQLDEELDEYVRERERILASKIPEE